MSKKYSYVSLLTNDNYTYGIVLLKESMKQVNTKYPLHVLVTDNVSTASLELLTQLGATYEVVDTIAISEDIYNYNFNINKRLAVTWKNCWTKFKIFDLTQFDKIVFLDADIMVLKNLDHLFSKKHMTAALDGEYFKLWPDRPHFNSGCMVIEPNHELFNDILNYANNFDVKDLYGEVFADQELLNIYFKDWVEKTELHLNKYYNIFGPYVQQEQLEELSKKTYFVHFTGRKPWNFWVKNPLETYSEFFYQQAKLYVENGIKTLDWNKIRSNLTLTVYAICKNEINNVERFLNSFSKADYLCIMDTGSTDGTWEYLQSAKEKYPNLIIDQQIITPWRYDTARNKSMKLIPKKTDIFFMADLDEEIRENDWPDKVKGAWDPLFSRGVYDYHRDLDNNGNIIRTIKEYRIHSREWVHWINIVHEAITTESGDKRFFMESCNPIDIEVWHYAKHQKTNYCELCEQDLLEYPDDWTMRLQLAIEYEVEQDYDSAVKHFNYILAHHENDLQDFEIARCFNGVARYNYRKQNYKQAEQLFLEGRLACPFFTDNYVEAMEMYFNTQNYYKAIELGKIALEFCREAQWCGNYDINNYYPYYIIGLSYLQQKDYITAIGYLEIALNKKNDPDIQKQMHNAILLKEQEIQEKRNKGTR